MTARRICLIAGDGIGQEVIPAGRRLLEATGLPWTFVEAEAGWGAFERAGTALPEETVAAVRSADATLFGAVSSPLQPVAGYRSPIVALRRSLDLYANLRPVLSQPVPASRPGIDLLIVRENSEGLYSGRERATDEEAVTERVITRRASERIARVAFCLAARRRGRVTIVHKANVLRATCGLFRATALAVAGEFPTVEVEEMLVDTMAMRLITSPERFDVVVTTNLFGDILSDEAAALVGGLGLAPSGNIGDQHAVFEPVHGSAPDIAGRGIANPIATFLAAAMLLDHLGEGAVAGRVRSAVEQTLRDGVWTPDLGGAATTLDVTNAVLERFSGS
ncbi:MAG: isocitrate/isopropylmalate dehydrogenase family protein [Chloroflexi bacterium]|nr:isocitrate/isopropylmalate dehydrogenase family protein [Chloroflexota bacterium]